MDIIITILIVLLLIFWPRMGQARYYILLFVGTGLLLIALIFAAFLFLSPLFYLGIILLGVAVLYKYLTKAKKEKS